MNKEQNTLSVNGNVSFTKIVTKEDGQEVKLIARYCPSPLSKDKTPMTIDVYKRNGDQWELCSDQMTGDSTWISREHYVNTQRPEKLKVASIGLLLKTGNEFKTLLNTPQNLFKQLNDKLHSFNSIKFDFLNA